MKSAKLIALERVKEIKLKALEVWARETVTPIIEGIEEESKRIFNAELRKVKNIESEVDTWL